MTVDDSRGAIDGVATVEDIAERAYRESEDHAGRVDAVTRVGAIVREFGGVLPINPDPRIRDRIDTHLVTLAQRLGGGDMFDVQRAWLFGYLDGRAGASTRTSSPNGDGSGSGWENGYRQGWELGSSERPAPVEPVTEGAAGPDLEGRIGVLRWILIGATVVTGATWLPAIRNVGDALLILVGAGIAAGIVVIFQRDRTDPLHKSAASRVFAGVALTIILSFGAWISAVLLDNGDDPHGPAGGLIPTGVWILVLIIVMIVQGRIRERLAYPAGRPIAGVRTYTASAAATSTDDLLDQMGLAQDPGELGLVGLLVFSFGGYRRPFRWSRRTGRLEFWLFAGVGLVLGALLISQLGALIVETVPDLILRLLAFAPLVVAALWWMLALIGSTARRLFDARVPRALALLWLAVPVVFVVAFTVASATLRARDSGDTATATMIALAAAGAVSLPLLAAGALRTRGASAAELHPRVTRRAIVDDLRDAGDQIRDLFSPDRIREIPGNGLTAGILFGCFLALCLAIVLPVPMGVRAALLVLVGLAFSTAHIARWVLQERYFATAIYGTGYSDGTVRAWKDPRWSRFLARPHKVLGLVWIWMSVITAATRETPAASLVVWCVLLLGYTIYLVYPVLVGIVVAGIGLPFLALGLAAISSNGASRNDQGFLMFALQVFFVWAIIASLWLLRMLFAGPKDRRTNQYKAYQQYVANSEW